jgi:CO dehydrogenase maturation factor
MNVWIVGKGGSGKTTVAGTLARLLARGDSQVLAVDLDNNPNLALSVGLGAQAGFGVTAVHQHILANGCPVDLTDGTEGLVTRYGVDGPEGVRLVQWSKIDDPAGAT